MPNVQWMSYSFIRLYLSKYDVCALNHIWINPKIFLIILYVFGSDSYHSFVFLFSAYFVFHCLNMFCIEKQVSEFFATRENFRNSSRDSPVAQRKSWVHLEALATHLWLAEIFAIEPGNSPSHEMSRISFLKNFFMGNLF